MIEYVGKCFDEILLRWFFLSIREVKE
jgi:hypothetical protein